MCISVQNSLFQEYTINFLIKTLTQAYVHDLSTSSSDDSEEDVEDRGKRLDWEEDAEERGKRPNQDEEAKCRGEK